MGVKDFTKVFPSAIEFTYKQLKNKNVAIDASVEIYRAALGMSSKNALTDSSGMPTAHINTLLLGVILKLKANDARQYWVFDHNQKKSTTDEFHNPMKELELKKRQLKRQKAKDKIEELQKKMQNMIQDKKSELFSSESEEEMTVEQIESSINKQEKIAFSIEEFYKTDLIFMLDMLEIPWIESPPGFEAEQLCAISTFNDNIFGVKINYVLTPDADALLFGAKKIIKKDIRKKKLFEYDLKNLLETYELSQQDLIKIGLMLGSDFAEKTPKVGPKSVLKKYKTVELTENQLKALNSNFNRKITDNELKSIVVNNVNKIPFSNEEKYKNMLDWLELVKTFNRARISKQFKKNRLFVDIN